MTPRQRYRSILRRSSACGTIGSLALAILFGALVACHRGGDGQRTFAKAPPTSTPAAAPEPTDFADAVVGKYWKLLEPGGEAVGMSAEQEREQSFTLRGDGTVAGFGGCRAVSGTYDVRPRSTSGSREDTPAAGSLAVGTLDLRLDATRTEGACGGLGVREAACLQVLAKAQRYERQRDSLRLYGATGRTCPFAASAAVYC